MCGTCVKSMNGWWHVGWFYWRFPMSLLRSLDSKWNLKPYRYNSPDRVVKGTNQCWKLNQSGWLVSEVGTFSYWNWNSAGYFSKGSTWIFSFPQGVVKMGGLVGVSSRGFMVKLHDWVRLFFHDFGWWNEAITKNLTSTARSVFLSPQMLRLSRLVE